MDLKTNREIFADKLCSSNTKEFVELVNAYGKCSRCSNSYWDGAQRFCHRNCNDSSCEMGQEEYFESYPNENLQLKYNKVYLDCKDNRCAVLLQQLVALLYASGVVTLADKKQCDLCGGSKEKCQACYVPFSHLMDCYYAYKRSHNVDITFKNWLKTFVISTIDNDTLRNAADMLYDLVYVFFENL